MEMEQAFARVLARFSASTRRCGCNEALTNDLRDVELRLGAARAALQELKEVGQAVDLLQKGKKDRRRSENLLEMLEEVGGLDMELRRGVKRLKRGFSGRGEKVREVEVKEEEAGKEQVVRVGIVKETEEVLSAEKKEDQGDEDLENEPQPSGDLLQRQAELCLGVAKTHPLGGVVSFKKTIGPLFDLLSAIKVLGDGTDDHHEVVKVAATAVQAFVKRISVLKLGLPHLSLLARLNVAIKKIPSPVFQLKITSASAELCSKLLEVKRNVLLLPNLHPCSRLVLEIDALPLAARLSRLDEITAALESGFHKVTKPITFQLIESVRLVNTWIDELTPAMATKEMVQTVGRFIDASLASTARSTASPDVRHLQGSLRWVKYNLDSMALGTSSTSSVGFPSDHPVHVIIRQLRVLPNTDRSQCLNDLVEALEFDFDGAPPSVIEGYERQTINAVKLVVTWVLSQPIDTTCVNGYARMCRAVQKMAQQFRRRAQYLQRMIDPLLTTMVRLNLTPSMSPEISVEEEDAWDCISRALVQVTTMQSGHPSAAEVDEVIKLLTWVFEVCTCESNWDPREDPNVLEVVINLRKCVTTLRKPEQRQKREHLVENWIAMLSKKIDENK